MIRLNKKLNSLPCSSAGTTAVELLIVLSIFAIITGVVMFDYNKFQSKVDIKNLANDIALRFAETQKSALDGKWSAGAGVNWKPSYGLYFNLASPGNNKDFIYFADLNGDKMYHTTDANFCVNPSTPNDECLDKTSISKGNTISEIRIVYINATEAVVDNIAMTFTRPNSGASFYSSGLIVNNTSYVQITVTSPKGINGVIKLYASGRIQIN